MDRFETYISLHEKRRLSDEASYAVDDYIDNELSPELLQSQGDFFTRIASVLEGNPNQDILNDMVFMTLWLCSDALKNWNKQEAYKFYVKHCSYYYLSSYNISEYSNKEFSILHNILALVFGNMSVNIRLIDIDYAEQEAWWWCLEAIYIYLVSELWENSHKIYSSKNLYALLSQWKQRNHFVN